MGNDNSKTGHQQKSTTETQKKLTDNFKVFSGANGELSLTQFIKTLASMDEFKELANSPLVNRLFNVFDKDKSGQISQSEYLAGLQEILTSDESKIKYTFLCFDKNNDDLVSLSEFVELFQEAWVQGFTLLQDSVQKKTSHGSNPNSSQIRDWAIKNKQVVADKVTAEFSRYSQNENMTFVQFREWIKTSNLKSVTAGFESIAFEIPLTLI